MRARFVFSLVIIFSLASGSSWAAEEKPSAESQFAVAEALRGSVGRVELTLRYDNGQKPKATGLGERCPNCGSYHGVDLEEALAEERPFELPAFCLSPTEVIAPDPMVHSRFVKSVAVRFGNELIPARPVAYLTGQSAMILKLDRPLAGAKPLAFDAAGKPPYLAGGYSQTNASWTMSVKGFSPNVALDETGRRFLAGPSYSLIVDSKGGPVGMSMNEELPAEGSWKGSPLLWPALSADERSQVLGKLEGLFSRGVFRVTLSFRSPKKTARDKYRGDDEESTECDVLGVLIDETRVLVLANLKPNVTARLQRIVLHPAAGGPIGAKFAHTLLDYGAFVATLEKPLPGALVFSKDQITAFRNKLLLSVDVELHGDKCTTYYAHSRIASFEVGWKRLVFPEIAGNDENLLLFDAGGRLVALPVIHREKIAERGGRSNYDTRLTPAAHLLDPLFGDPAKHIDRGNVPLTEEQESRLAWLGAELQPLDRELARLNKVSELTRNGEIGGLVSYVYPGSPAAEAGIKQGDVLVRLHVEGEPKPIDIKIEEDRFHGEAFPWDRLDEVPDRFFEEIPRPWPPVENDLARTLTNLGFGKKFAAEFSRDGQVFRKEFAVTESPAHYDSAEKHKSDELGLTVRDMTYEVRRYFQKTAEDHGVIVSKIEPGSKASVSGLKPYELVTHVDGKPVANVREFEKLLGAEKGELRLSISRMAKGRIVTIKR